MVRRRNVAVKVAGAWRYLYRPVDQHGQVIDVLVSARRDADAARRFFRRAIARLKVKPSEVVTDAAAVYPAVLDELLPSAWHHVEQHANNPIEADHAQLKHQLRPMRGLQTDRNRVGWRSKRIEPLRIYKGSHLSRIVHGPNTYSPPVCGAVEHLPPARARPR